MTKILVDIKGQYKYGLTESNSEPFDAAHYIVTPQPWFHNPLQPPSHFDPSQPNYSKTSCLLLSEQASALAPLSTAVMAFTSPNLQKWQGCKSQE